MPQITIYTKTYCPYCDRAKNLLKAKKATFEEVNVEEKEGFYEELKKRTGMMTVPQIFIGDRLIGGYTDLAALDQKGELDPLLQA